MLSTWATHLSSGCFVFKKSICEGKFKQFNTLWYNHKPDTTWPSNVSPSRGSFAVRFGSSIRGTVRFSPRRTKEFRFQRRSRWWKIRSLPVHSREVSMNTGASNTLIPLTNQNAICGRSTLKDVEHSVWNESVRELLPAINLRTNHYEWTYWESLYINWVIYWLQIFWWVFCWLQMTCSETRVARNRNNYQHKRLASQCTVVRLRGLKHK